MKFDNGLWGLITRLTLAIIKKPLSQLHETHLEKKIWFQTRLLVPSNPIFQFNPRLNIQKDS